MVASKKYRSTRTYRVARYRQGIRLARLGIPPAEPSSFFGATASLPIAGCPDEAFQAPALRPRRMSFRIALNSPLAEDRARFSIVL
jgi:hypothetical protein